MAEGTNVGSIYYDLNLETAQFEAGLAKSKAQASGFGSSLENIGSSMSSLGSKIMPFSIAAGVALGASTKMAIDFNQQMELLATQAGASQQEVDSLKDKVLALAPAVGQGPDKLAEALYHIESVGYRGAAAMDVLKIAAEGAAVGQANLDDTTYALTSTMATQIQGAQTAAEAMGTLNAIVGAGDMRFQDLNGAISTGILSSAKVFGLSLASVGSALATLTDNGEHADEAATRLRMTMALMGAPSSKAAGLLTDIGMSSNEAMSRIGSMNETLKKAGLTQLTLSQDLRQPNGFMVALTDLKTHLEGAGLSADASAALMAKAFGGGRSDAAMMTMFTNLDRMDTKFKSINTNSGNFGKDWAAQQEQAAQKMKDFQAQLDVTMVKLGNAFLPTLLAIAKQLGKIADAFSGLSPGAQKAIADILLFVLVLGPILKVGGNIVTLFGLLADGVSWLATTLLPLLTGAFTALAAAIGISVGWLVLIVLAVIAVGVGIYELVTHWKQVVKFVEDLWHKVAKFFENLWHDVTKFVGNVVKDVLKFFKDLPGHIKDAIAKLPHLILKVLEDMAYMFGLELRLIFLLVTQWIPDIVKKVIDELTKLPGQVAQKLTDFWNTVVDWFGRTKTAVWNKMKEVVDDIVNWFKSIPGAIVNWLKDIKTAAGKVAQGIWDGINDIIKGIPGLVGDIFGKVKDKIFGWAGDIAKAAKHVASSMWDAFKSGLGIHSPSYIEVAFSNIQDAGQKTVDNLKNHVGKLADLTGQAAKVGMLPVGISNLANQPLRVANLTINGDINFKNQQDIDYWFSKLGRNTQLASQGLTGAR